MTTEAPKKTMDEQIDTMLPVMNGMMPQVAEVAQVYHRSYPADKTDDAVLNAVTVPVPLKTFMIMTAIVMRDIVAYRKTLAAKQPAEPTPPASEGSRGNGNASMEPV